MGKRPKKSTVYSNPPFSAKPEPGEYDTPARLQVEIMKLTLEAAVPLWQAQLAKRPFDEVIKRAGVCAEEMGSHGDVLQFGGRGAGDAFNRLAEGLAALSFSPGGVTFSGLHFEAQHPDGQAA